MSEYLIMTDWSSFFNNALKQSSAIAKTWGLSAEWSSLRYLSITEAV